MDDEVLEINGKQYVEDPNHMAAVILKKSGVDRNPDDEWAMVDWKEVEGEPEHVEAEFVDLIPWKDGEESNDLSTYDADFCSYHKLIPEDVIEIQGGLG